MGNIPAHETFEGTFPFAPHFSEKPGFRMHYVDEGQGDPIVLLHGFPSWSYLYRNFIPPLARHHRVIAVDHMGYGKSATPSDRQYNYREHVQNLERLLIDDLDLHDITLVVHDIGGIIGGGFAWRHVDRIKRLFVQNTMIVNVFLENQEAVVADQKARSEYIQWLRRLTAEGRFAQAYDNLDFTIPYLLTQFVMNTPVTRTVAQAYSAAFARQEDSHAATGVYRLIMAGEESGETYHFGSLDDLKVLHKKPAMMAFGMQDRAVIPDIFIPFFEKTFLGAPVVRLENAGHFLQEDAPETLVALIEAFIQLT